MPAVKKLISDGGWQSLIENVKVVKSTVEMVGDDSAAWLLEMEGDLGEIEYKLSILKTYLGERPDDLGTATVFKLLENLMDATAPTGSQQGVRFRNTLPSSLAMSNLSSRHALLDRDFCTFKATLSGTVYAEIKKAMDKTLSDENCPFQVNLARPVIRFLQQWSSGPD
ncbi:hypothetical protein ACA910_018674 [Epithemia clementina (nom. ined.)]